jgi:elongation of very long chain fatty acids protein 6
MTWSKIVELGDTAFIVLRKQPLIFLHWYHHITVLVYTWVNYIPYDPPLRYFMTINFCVHGLMYAYYALKAMKIRVPRNWAMMITVLQLSQMVVGVTINVYSLWIKFFVKLDCDRDVESIYTAFAMYASYFILFSHFFYRSYFAKKKLE